MLGKKESFLILFFSSVLIKFPAGFPMRKRNRKSRYKLCLAIVLPFYLPVENFFLIFLRRGALLWHRPHHPQLPICSEEELFMKNTASREGKRRGGGTRQHRNSPRFCYVRFHHDALTPPPKKEMLFREMPCFVSAFQTCLKQKSANGQ